MKKSIYALVLISALNLPLAGQDYPEEFFLGEKFTLNSNILNKGVGVFVYLPMDYYTDTTSSYPVHFVTDAPAISNVYFDLLRLQSSVNMVPKAIVVGLSGDDRNTNLFPGSGADTYLNYLKLEVIPFINETYRTNPFRVLAGHSLGGAFALYAHLKEPELFNAFIVGSPGPLNALEPLLKSTKPKEGLPENHYTFLYASIGSDDLVKPEEFTQFETIFRKYSKNTIDCGFFIHPEENHITNIAVNFQRGLSGLYHDWIFEFPDQLTVPADQYILDHYKSLEKRYGSPIKIGEFEVLYPAVDQLAMRGDLENGIRVLHLCAELYPHSDQVYLFLAQAYYNKKDLQMTQKYLDKSLELNPENKYSRAMKVMLENQ